MTDVTGLGIRHVLARLFEDLKQFVAGANRRHMFSFDATLEVARDGFISKYASNRIGVGRALANHQRDVG